ncbi:MAG: zinc ribbon domain-containing protein [Pseudomonadota bacterium]
MPIYEYACTACGHRLDALQKIADAPLTQCPACNQPTLKKQLSAPSFRLKGQGWYETDFKKDGDKKRNLADDGAKPASAKKEAGDGATSSKAKSETTSSGTSSKTSSSSDGGKAA